MKNAFCLLSFAFCLLFIAGCQEPVKQKPVEVTIEGGGQFPAFLAGRWATNQDDGGWQIVFEPNGTISSIVHTMGRITMEPGKTVKVPMLMEKESIYEPGKWIVNYDPATNILTVEIKLEHFHTEIGTGTVDGSMTDVFVGPVSEDKLVWNVNWTTFLKSVARTPEKPYTDLSTDPDGESKDIVFNKVLK